MSDDKAASEIAREQFSADDVQEIIQEMVNAWLVDRLPGGSGDRLGTTALLRSYSPAKEAIGRSVLQAHYRMQAASQPQTGRVQRISPPETFTKYQLPDLPAGSPFSHTARVADEIEFVETDWRGGFHGELTDILVSDDRRTVPGNEDFQWSPEGYLNRIAGGDWPDRSQEGLTAILEDRPVDVSKLATNSGKADEQTQDGPPTQDKTSEASQQD